MPATTLTATYLAGGTPVTDTYTGVSLWTLITSAGLVSNSSIKNDVLRKYVVAVGTDGYEAVISLSEIDPMFGNQPDLVAYADTEGQLGSGGADGFARIVVPGDSAGGRYVSNLIELGVFDASVPEPRGIALFVTATLALAFVRRASPRRPHPPRHARRPLPQCGERWNLEVGPAQHRFSIGITTPMPPNLPAKRLA